MTKSKRLKEDYQPVILSKEIYGLGEIQVSAFVYGSIWANKSIKKKAHEFFPGELNFYHVTFYVEGFGDGILFFVRDKSPKVWSVHPHLRARLKKDKILFKTLFELVQININEGRILTKNELDYNNPHRN
jgi:hypothetical protein